MDYQNVILGGRLSITKTKRLEMISCFIKNKSKDRMLKNHDISDTFVYLCATGLFKDSKHNSPDLYKSINEKIEKYKQLQLEDKTYNELIKINETNNHFPEDERKYFECELWEENLRNYLLWDVFGIK